MTLKDRNTKGESSMKRMFAVLLVLCTLVLSGCSGTVDRSVPIFSTENIIKITFHSTVKGTVYETEVPDEYMSEITAWLGTVTVGKRIEGGILPPGANSIYVRIEYEDGNIVDESLSTVTIDGEVYLTQYDKEPACYFDLFEQSEVQ